MTTTEQALTEQGLKDADEALITQFPSDYGPYPEYLIVTTQYGEYGLEAGDILFFEHVDKLNRETGKIEKVPVPRYRDSGAVIPAHKPYPPKVANARAAQAPNAEAAREAREAFEAAKAEGEARDETIEKQQAEIDALKATVSELAEAGKE